MIYFLAYFRRLTVKSCLYFSLIPALVISIYYGSFFLFISLICIFTLFQYAVANFINYFDLKKKTNLACVLCGFSHCSLLYPAGKKNYTSTKGSFACSSFDHGKHPDIYYCPNCKNGFLKNILDNDKAFFEDGINLYEEVEDEEYIKNLEARYITNKKIIKSQRHFFIDRSVLEVGSYYGAFAKEIINFSKNYVGIEPSKHACKYVKNKFPDIEIINSNIDSIANHQDLKNRKFDTIVLWDVIEHLPNPVNALKTLNKFLKDDGVIIFSTINIESVFSIAMGPKWPWFMDMHYYYFSDRGYIDILHRSGFVMENHLHYPYYVKLSYFIKKVASIVGIKINLSKKLEEKLKFYIKLRLGDTVMVIGKKASL